MKQHEKLEFKMVLEHLANTFVESGITAEDVNTATVKLSNFLKTKDVLNEQDQPGFFSKVGDFLGGLSARAGFRNAMSPNQLEQQRKAIIQSLTNYVNSLENANIKGARPVFTAIAREINGYHKQALRAKGFGGPGLYTRKPVNTGKNIKPTDGDPTDTNRSPHPVFSTMHPDIAANANKAILDNTPRPSVNPQQVHSAIASANT